MSFWDNVKKFTQPYADDYDEYEEEEEGVEGFEEAPAERPARARRTPAFIPAEEASDYNAPAASAAPAGFSGHVDSGYAVIFSVIEHVIRFACNRHFISCIIRSGRNRQRTEGRFNIVVFRKCSGGKRIGKCVR